jgi:hypothetical protein
LDEESGIADSDVLIYAYQNKGIVQVSSEWLSQSNGKGTIRVFTANGELLDETRLLDVRTELNLPDDGVYIIRVVANGESHSGKVIARP